MEINDGVVMDICLATCSSAVTLLVVAVVVAKRDGRVRVTVRRMSDATVRARVG